MSLSQESGSIREASVLCHLSPAAIHKHLKTLESEFGVQLYRKNNGRLIVTEAGQILLPFLREILLGNESAFTAVAEWKDGKHGLVRVGAGPSFSSDLLPVLLKQFRRRFPKVNVFVETGDSSHLMARLRSGARKTYTYKRSIDYFSGRLTAQPVQFTTNAFTPSPQYGLGNTRRTYASLRKPPFRIESFDAMKYFRITNTLVLTLRMDYFNAFNRTQLPSPDFNISDSTFGMVTSQSSQISNRQGQATFRIEF